MTDALVAELRQLRVEVLTHDQWGSQRRDVYEARLTSRPHDLLPGRPVDTLWNHITVTSDDGLTGESFAADMREVERIGYERFGTGVSYNILVDRNAPRPRVAIGQLLEARGAHTINDKGVPGYSLNQNKVALAVAWVGVPGDILNEHAVEAMVLIRVALIRIGALTRHYDDVPHSLVAWKDCPCDELRDRLPALKRDALRRLDTTTKENDMGYSDWTDKDKKAFWNDLAKFLRGQAVAGVRLLISKWRPDKGDLKQRHGLVQAIREQRGYGAAWWDREGKGPAGK